MSLDVYLAFVIVLLGIYGLTKSRHIIKSIILLNITQSGVVVLLISFAYKSKDPLPQALMITTIVIGAAITALALMMSIKIFHYYGTLKWKKLLKREG